MKTIIITSVKDFNTFETDISVTCVNNLLEEKGAFIKLTKIGFDKKRYKMLLRKTAIKLVKEKKGTL